MKREITTGDMMHVYGCFGAGADYTVRITVRLTERIDPAVLRKAVDAAALRYPYFCVRLTKGAETLYYEDNPLPIVILPTEERICLNSPAVNHHVWAVCFAEDRIHLDFFHGISDGTGMYSVLATLLYYYGREHYGITAPGGIPTDDIPADEAELTDPQDELLQTEHMPREIPPMEQAFTLEIDGELTPSEATLWDITIPEDAFIRFTSANDASPGTMISLLLARAIDSLYPERTKKIISAYVINARPMLGAEKTYHNCLSMAMFPYTEKLKALPFSHQCTVYRGMTFLQSDADRIVPVITENADHVKQAALAAATLEEKKDVFGQMFRGGEGVITFLVSYVGRWHYPAVADMMCELWVHPPNTFSLMAEINAVGGSICLSLQQRFREDSVREAFLRQLEENGIPYRIVRKIRSDNAAFPEPQ
ncbi:MAG: hypothetical protein IJR62_06325 [Lachnospiraceae bacterium]|nr:hypothetical protein [Lachnospiraceae bacterium]